MTPCRTFRPFRVFLGLLLVVTRFAIDKGMAAEIDLSGAALKVSQIIAHRGASVERPEGTLASLIRAIEAGATAVEVDVRTSRDGELFLLHDPTLDRTTNGKGPASNLTLSELQALDAGSWFGETYRGERIPSLREAVRAARGRIDLLLDLKEQGEDYDRKVVEVIRQEGSPACIIVGVRSVEQAQRFRQLLPEARQLALIPDVQSIEAFARAGVETIRLWPRWLKEGDEPVQRVRATGCGLHLNGTLGGYEETRELLTHAPDSLSSDDPARQRRSLAWLARDQTPTEEGHWELVAGEMHASQARLGSRSFSNRDYVMQQIPEELLGQARWVFPGGLGNALRVTFRQPSVVFAVFDYNQTGVWSFPNGQAPESHGWKIWRKDAYRGSSNSGPEGTRVTDVWYSVFQTGETLQGLPQWWLCLAVVPMEKAADWAGVETLMRKPKEPEILRWHAPEEDSAALRPMQLPVFTNAMERAAWQAIQREAFLQKFSFSYRGPIQIQPGEIVGRKGYQRQVFHVLQEQEVLFRYFVLQPDEVPAGSALPAVACFMGHGRVTQVLEEEGSYQHAFAAALVRKGYRVYVMENVGMEPGPDHHLDLDQALRLEGKGWYSLLFAHQRLLLEQVFQDPKVDPHRVGAAGVSTGGLLALSAAALDPRIRATSVQGIFGSMRQSFVHDRRSHCTCGAIPGLLPDYDLPEWALWVAPRSLHVSNGRDDGFGPVEARRCVDAITPFFRHAGGMPPHFTIPKGGHAFDLVSTLEFFKVTLLRD